MANPISPRDLFRLSNDIHLDLITGTQAYYTFQLPPFATLMSESHTAAGITRLGLFHAVLTLSKWSELYDRYQRLIPEPARSVAKALKKDLERRGVRDFRNTFVGHIWDDRVKRPLTFAEVDAGLAAVTGADVPAFMRWINDPDLADASATVVGIVEQVRDAVQQAHGFTDADLTF